MDGLCSIGGGKHAITQIAEEIHDHVAKRVLIFHEQNGLRASKALPFGLHRSLLSRPPFHPRFLFLARASKKFLPPADSDPSRTLQRAPRRLGLAALHLK